MLIEFAVTNFRSIREEQTLSLLAAKALKELPDNLLPNELAGMKRERVLRSAAIYGPNASGKSTIFTALEYLRTLVRGKSTNNNPGDPTGVTPFALDDVSLNKPSVFRLTFVASDGVRYEYGVALTQERIIQEALTAYPNGKAQLRYRREWNAESKRDDRYDWQQALPLAAKHLRESTRENALFLTTAVQLNNQELRPVLEWFTSHLEIGDLSHRVGVDDSVSTNIIVDRLPLSDKLKAAMRVADLGITDALSERVTHEVASLPEKYLNQIPLEERSKAKANFQAVKFHHRTEKGDSRALPMENESVGTLRFYSLIGPLLMMLDRGATVLLDEIDTSLHPLMVKEMVKLFLSPETNPRGAQLIFTTHNPLLLDTELLRRDQIWFTEKDEGGATHLYPLTDYSPRKDESLVRGYLAGRYGAIPFIPNGLIPKESAKTKKGVS